MPIDGEAGVGYLMREGFDLPPLMFTRDEIVALVAGARMVRAFGGAAMARAADEALVKIGAVLPDNERDRIARTEIHTPMWVVTDADRINIDLLERSVEKRDVLTLDYRDELGRGSGRDVRPLGLWFWGKVWTLAAWCELRNDFRAFRIDRIASIVHAGRTFKPERGKLLADFYRRMERENEPRPETRQQISTWGVGQSSSDRLSSAPGGLLAMACRKVSLMRSCQPGPSSWKYSSTARSIRIETSSRPVGAADGSRVGGAGFLTGLKAASAAVQSIGRSAWGICH